MKIACVSFLVGTLLLDASSSAALTSDQVNEITRSIVHVLCDLPDGGQQGGSGFVYHASNQVVTSFHVVAAASNPGVKLHVFSTGARLDRPAKIVQVLRAADLALLEVDQSFGLPTLRSDESNPSFGAELVAFGHPLFTPTVQRQILKFDKEEPLQDIAPLRANQEIGRLG